jgi:amino acid adenylation domain-containing protein
MSSVATLTELTLVQRRELLKMALARDLVRDRSELPPIEHAPREGRLPLSFAQERLWFIDRMEPGSAVYNIPVAWRLDGALDVAALERALGEIVRRHEALRTTFAESDGSPVQVIAPFAGFTLPVEDLSGLGGADREAAVSRRAGEESRRAFDLAAGPLFRAALLRLDADDHVLLLSMHHIVSDGWSMGVLYGELSALYEAYREGRTSPLPELRVQYADYAAWQREHLRDSVLEAKLAYWRKRLAGAPELLELPTDHPRPAVQTFRGAHERSELPGELLERLQALGRSEGATLNMVLLGAFQVLLSKYSGSDDIVVGSPIAGRTRKELEETIGFFVNTVVLRTDLSGDPSFREVLRRAREATLGAHEHQEVPFERLVAELQPERSMSHSPLFQVMFALQNAVDRGVTLSGLDVSEAGVELAGAKFDLSFTAKATARGLRVGLIYSTDLFERSTVERMLGHLARVLEQVAADADVRLSRLDLLGGTERALVLEEWNRTERPYPRGVCIHELFQAQVRERPGAVALVWDGAELTYQELETRANRLAHHLVRRGVGPDARVGVLLERGVELIVSLLAVLKAGGCYVPLDPAYPAERLRLMLDDSSVRVLISRSDLAGVVETGDLDVIHLDHAAGAIASEPVEAPRGGATAENLAYIVYTSGSTGRPKGVMVGHRQVVQLVVETDYVQLRPGDHVAQASNAGFDALTFEVWGAFLNGATLVGIPQDVLLSPPALRATLREQHVTTIFLTTALVNQLSREEPDIFAPLREVLFGGQAVDADSVRRLLKAGGPERLLHMYGPTETTTFCLYEQVEHVAEDALTVPLGHATGNQRIYLLDGALNPVPLGVPGEAYVGGAGVSRGYLDRPGLTAERFVPDPFSTEPGARMYRTGDRMRWRGERKLEFVGRVDDQVKIRGFRIEPGEVESALSAHAAVREARVIVREDVPGDKRLVAYVVGDVEAEEVRAYLRGSLPEYMLPAAFVFMDALPLTPNGKVDRKALPAPEYASAEERYVAPRTPVEEVLAGIWAEVLRLERVGVEESFFDLGGHSLLATRMMSRVRELFGVELPLRALFEGPTVAQMAGRVEDERRRELPVLAPVVPVERTGPLPLSFAQERLWFIDRMEPGSAVYNVPVAWRLAGVLDVDALERALGEIVRRHETLRTVFAQADGSPVQVIAPFAGFALPMEDLSGLGEADREAAVQQRAGEEARRPFDLSAGPLFRAALLRLGAEDHLLMFSMHHIVSDGWSMGVLYRELSALYAAYREGAESPLAELPVQYADYAVWQREQLEGEALDRQLGYWRGRLAGAPELLELPTDHPRPAVQTYRGATVPVELSAELLERLQALGRSEGTTLYMTLLGAFQVLLSKYSGSDDVVVGSPIAGRTRKETEELIGFFVNTLVLRTDLSGDPSFREVLRRAREVTLGAYEHQEVPFERLVAELSPERSLSHAPLFQVMFALQTAEGRGGALAGLEVSGIRAELASAKFDLSLALTATEQGLRGGLTYSTDLFERGTVDRMLGHLERVLEQVAADADVRLSRLELLGEAERALVLEAWNPAAAEYPADRCIHELFQAQAARTPGAIAATGGTVALTYAELNARANRLARHLVRLGVGPEARVGVCLERGPELMVCTLAVLKAGGAYVAMDPAYPPARLELMLRDSGAAVLLTDGRGAAPAEQDGVHVVRVDRDAHAFAAESAADLPNRVSPRNVAYVVYTSGSTGTPKGVAVDHASLGALCAWHVRAFGVTAADRGTQVASPGFDAAVWEVWPYLTRGASVHVVPEEVRADPPALRDWLVRHEATVSFIPTPVAEPMLALEWPADAALRWMLTGGDRLRARPAAGMPFAMSNNYGPTECTVVATSGTVRTEGVRAPSIGGPIENTRIYVLDAGVRPLPAGVPGELCIGGAQVARGYLNRPALTAERFVPDPFSPTPGARLYRSGDKVRWLEESAEVRECVSAEVGSASADSRTNAPTHSRTGVLEYLGRLDEQVKVRGFRIELGEIEATLRRDPGVADCAVIARDDERGEKRLAAYVVGDADAEALRDRLRASLPEYMVPSAFVFMDALPLTANGKLDRKALPAPEFASAKDRYVAPRTPVEEVLAGIWAEVLRLERVGVEESFFDLGGHSLLATRMASRVRELFGVELPLRALFEGPTVAQMAGRVEDERRRELPVLPPVVPAERTGPLPLSFAQERLWFIDRMEPGSAVYNIPVAWRLGGVLHVDALERSLGEIVRRHEALRTVFAEADGSPVQVIVPFDGFRLTVQDLSHLPAETHEAEFRRRAGEEARRAFDLAAGPLFRATLLRLGAEDHALLLSMHHIVSDGWSMGVLYPELSALYAAYREGRTSPLPELAVQYADYAVWQREQLEGDVLDRQLAYWRERLAGAPELLELPTDHPRPAVQTYRGATVPVELSAELLERLQALGRNEGTTLYMTLLAAFQVLLAKYSGSEDVVVGSPIAGRTRKETEELIGFFVNTLVLRTDLSGDPSFREVLRRAREVTLGAYEHQEVPFERLVAELSPERSLSHAPLFQVLFALQNAGGGAGALAGLEVSGIAAELGSAKFDLSLGLAATEQGLRGGMTYSTDLFERATVERMLSHLARVLEQVAADADVRLSRLELLGETERTRLLALGEGAAPEFPRATVDALFAQTAAAAPQAVALAWDGGRMTYAELDDRANRLGHHLRRAGVARGTRVGVCLERGPEMIVATLAALKAGGAYVPLDAAYPAERLAFMLADTAVPVLVTESALADRLPAHAARVIRVDDDAAAIAAEPADALAAETDLEAAAYVMYTSGSTGQPKGVEVPHRAIVRLVRGQDYISIDPSDVFLQLAPASFDAATLELWGPLLNGARLAIHPAGQPSVESIGRALAEHGVTVLWLTAGLFHLVVEERIEMLRGVRQLLAGGDVLSVTHVRRVLEELPETTLINGYGPTENTTFTCCHRIAEVPAAGGSIPVGRPIANTYVRVLDAAMQPVPVGVPGELYAGGAGLALGYLNRPELTAEKFVADPFVPGARLYRTGDRVRWRADGTVEFLGRVDFQVKIRGFRIELGEIESALRDHPGVRDALALVRTDGGEKRLAGYVVPVEGTAVDAASLRGWLRERLPEYMVPAAWCVMDAFPLNSSGKVNRHALPAPEGVRAEASVPPRTEAERKVAAVWADVVGVETVGAHDNFFDLGGHSLLLVKAQSRLREAFGVPVPITHLFRYLTVSALAAELETPAPQPAAAAADDARVRDGRHRLRARARAGVNG